LKEGIFESFSFSKKKNIIFFPFALTDYGVNLSISLAPGKENNSDSISNGE
jgi:hypothetical protein